MGCNKCKAEYRISLVNKESSDLDRIKNTLEKIFNWNEDRINSIVEISARSGKCHLFDVGKDEMIRLSKKLLINNIPYQIEKK